MTQRRQVGVVDLTKVSSKSLVGEEGLGAPILGARERSLVVVHPVDNVIKFFTAVSYEFSQKA